MNIRNCLWLAALGGALGGGLLSAATPEPGFRSLFNGTDLTGWDGDPQFWSVREGAITGQSTPEKPVQENTFIIWGDGMVDDFELHLSYRIVGNSPENFGNSGIQYRSRRMPASKGGHWVAGGYQADIECGPNYSGILYEERGRGILATRGQKVTIDPAGKPQVTGSVGESKAIQAAIKAGDWNEYVIIAQGWHLIHKINGHVTVDVTDEQAAKRVRSGLLGFQMHVGKPMTVQFKDIFLKRLPVENAKKIVLIPGSPSHGPGDHEHNAGIALWKHSLDQIPGVVAVAYLSAEGWPKDPSAFDNADAAVFFSDGGDGHPLLRGDRLRILGEFVAKGKGVAMVHYTVEVPKTRGGALFTDWIGGFYETGYSINPFWKANFQALPEHPITRGVRPFAIEDEWYYNLRLATDQPHVLPLLTATPPDDTRGTPAAKEHPGRVETLSWCVERSDGGRGFGYTGGHVHKNWANDDVRKFLLNAFLWTAKGEIPPQGLETQLVPEDIQWNLDEKDGAKTKPAPWLPTVRP